MLNKKFAKKFVFGTTAFITIVVVIGTMGDLLESGIRSFNALLIGFLLSACCGIFAGLFLSLVFIGFISLQVPEPVKKRN